MKPHHRGQWRTGFFCAVLLVCLAGGAEATSYVRLGLSSRVQLSDTIVLGRIVDAERAVVQVDRVLKGEPPKQIVLVDYIDNMTVPQERKPLVLDSRELLFLTGKRPGYAPLQTQYGRLTVEGDRLIDGFRTEQRNLTQTLASIEQLVAFQARAARGAADADAAYVAAIGASDVELQTWALWDAKARITAPSRALADAVVACWPGRAGRRLCSFNGAGSVANLMVEWRLSRLASVFASVLSASGSADDRPWAAMALGGTGDRAYLPLLRRVAAQDADPQARALAYNGIMYMLGPESLSDFQRGARDSHEKVRAQVVGSAYNILELERPDRRWAPASAALIADVRQFLAEMQDDPAPLVRTFAATLSFSLARLAPQLETIPNQLARLGTSLTSGPSIPSGLAPTMDRVLENTDLIIRGTVGHPRSYLTEDQVDVLTDFPIRNATLLYSRDKQLAAPESGVRTVTVTLRGGQIEINKLTFTSGHAALPLLEPGTDVILCLQRPLTKYVPAMQYYGAFAVRDGEVVPLTRKQGFAPELRGVAVDQVVATWVTRAPALHARPAKAP